MSGTSNIEWTDATWNPSTGCSKVSPGCSRCYAETLDKVRHEKWYGEPHVPWTVKAQKESGRSAVTLHPDRLDWPLKHKKPMRIFVDSMSDLFHEDVPFEFIEQVWDTMFDCLINGPAHIFQILTKRIDRALEFSEWMNNVRLRRIDYENVWLGVSVENQRYAEERIPLLLQTPAAVRFLSVEPMLERVDLKPWLRCAECDDGPHDDHQEQSYEGCIDWTICGAESGPSRRPFDEDWARDLRDQCVAAGVAFFFKQGSAFRPGQNRVLDGREWQEFPKAHEKMKERK